LKYFRHRRLKASFTAMSICQPSFPRPRAKVHGRSLSQYTFPPEADSSPGVRLLARSLSHRWDESRACAVWCQGQEGAEMVHEDMDVAERG
jgi:hypothetical protein